MITKMLEQKIENLSKEVAQLRDLVLGGNRDKDPEGEYKSEFVKRINRIAMLKSSGIKYTTRADLAKRIGL